MPSSKEKGSPSIKDRFIKAPGSPSSALQIKYFGLPFASLQNSHFLNEGKPAPPRPRSPDALTSSTVHLGSLFGSISSDVSALITENCFEFLDAPVKRVASIETPIPFQGELEKQYLPKHRFASELKTLIDY